MNRILLILLFIGIIYSHPGWAQNDNKQLAEKPSSDACPTWNKKSGGSKADYFLYLRKSPKAAKASEIARYNQRNKDFNKPVYTSLVPQKTVPATEPEKDQAEEKQEDKKPLPETQSPSTIPTVSIQTAQTTEVKPELPALTINENAVPDSANKTEKAEVKEKDKKKSKSIFSFHNSERKHWLRKIKFRKKGPATCPDF